MTANPSAPAVTVTTGGPLAWVTLDNPARMNALSSAMWRALPDAIARAENDGAVRVVVLRGAGTQAFSAGADISEFETARSGDAVKDYDALNHAAFEAVANCSKPVIAMIHGFCMGGGLGLALACDIRLADEKASLAIPAARLGLGYNPRWLKPLLSTVSAARAKDMLFTARRYSAAEALQMGLVNCVTGTDALYDETATVARTIAVNAPLTMTAAKRAIDALSRDPAGVDMAALEDLVEVCFQSADYAEGRQAFLEKRKPRFEGR